MVVYHSSTSAYKPNFVQFGKTFCGQRDIETSFITSTLRNQQKKLNVKREKVQHRNTDNKVYVSAAVTADDN